MSMGAFKAAKDMYILHKFGRLLSSTSAVNAVNCVLQASISTRVNSYISTRGSKFVFRY